jgi:hypothetical protein
MNLLFNSRRAYARYIHLVILEKGSTGLVKAHIAGQNFWTIMQNKHLSNKGHFIVVVKNGITRYILNSA